MAEATMICVDNSEWMRNSDFIPTRLEAQRDAIQLISGRKIHAHPESCVGVMTMAGSREILTTLTNDTGKISGLLHRVNVDGSIDFLSSLKVAKLALKFRQAKNHRQRVIVFVGSPIENTEGELKQLGKKFHKDGVAVDVINFGEEEANQQKLETFIQAVDKGENSHLVTVPSGVRVLSDVLIKSAILSSGDNDGVAGGGDDLVDPNIDPELALALRVSLEESRARERQAQQAAGESAGETTAPAANETPMEVDDGMDDDLRAAMQMSMQGMDGGATLGSMMDAPQEKSLDMMTEEEQIEYAIRMSTQAAAKEEASAMDTGKDGAASATEPAQADAALAQLSNPDFLKDVFGGIEGVDTTDENLQKAMENIQKGKTEDKDDKKDEKK
eukprot:m.289648 g.289648  ORF g.289648 m.289648 type:complete len:387 (-) comp16376_c3_seq3:1240-2400(-)